MAVSSRTRVSDLAKELGITDRKLVAKASEHGMALAVFSRLDKQQADQIRSWFSSAKKRETQQRSRAGGGRRVVRRRTRATGTQPAVEAEAPASVPEPVVAPPAARPAPPEAPAPVEPEVEVVAAAPEPAPQPVVAAPAPVTRRRAVTTDDRPRIRKAHVDDIAAPPELQPKTMIQADEVRRVAEEAAAAKAAEEDARAQAELAAQVAARPQPIVHRPQPRERPKIRELNLKVGEIGQALDVDNSLPSQSRVPRLKRAKMPDILVNLPKLPPKPPPAPTPPAAPDTRGRGGPPQATRSGGPGGRNDQGGRGRKVIYDRRRDGGRGFGDDRRRNRKRRPKGKSAIKQVTTVAPKAEKRHLKIEDTITVSNLAHQMSVKSTEVIKKLFDLGIMATINHTLDLDTVELVAAEFGFTVENVAFDLESYLSNVAETEVETISRPPVVTVMGHVDHGKTTLLDKIRSARVAAREAGGITQHIGAYAVDIGESGRVLFLDTPGHEAFTAMRARGARATDIIVLVVAADDGVMPQTIEAINHSKAAGVPIIVAINKIDKEGANVDRVRRELAEQNVVLEDWGGDVTSCEISAKTGKGIDELLETLALQSEIMELTAPINCDARGLVIEARLERGRGAVATLLIQQGKLKRGSYVVAGSVFGRVRAMHNDKGAQLAEAGPETPVEVIGLGGVAVAGDEFVVAPDEKSARAIVDHRISKAREKEAAKTAKVTLDSMFAQMESASVKELNLIIKADVHGSAEALKGSLNRLIHDDVKVKVLHAAVGGVTESDIQLASASGAYIIAFNVKPEAKGKRLAEDLGVKIESFSVIYEAIDFAMLAMEGMLDPIVEEIIHGQAEVRAVFHIAKTGSVAGCYITNGKVVRKGKMRLFREDELIWEGNCSSLKRFKDDVAEVTTGYECGISLAGGGKVHVGDRIESYELKRTPRKLDLPKVYRPAAEAV